MARVKLTAGRIRDFECPPDKFQAFLWDSEAPGLAVRATQSAKSFIFQGKLSGKSIRITIGDVRVWPIESTAPQQIGARQEARNLQGLIDKGIDPRQEKREQIAAAEARLDAHARRETTFGDAWNAYVQSRYHKWGERHLRDHLRAVLPGGEKITRGRRTGENDTTQPGMLHSLVGAHLSDLTSKRLQQWLIDANTRGPTEAAKCFRLLRAFIHWCSEQEQYSDLVSADACKVRAVRDHVQRAKAKDDCLQREQLQPWFSAIRSISNPVISSYLQACLLTGARREEMAGLQWRDVDFRWKSLTIRDKVEGERTIPLTPYVAWLLARLPQREMLDQGNTVPNPWVFSSPTAKSGRLQEPRIPHNKALAATGLPPLSIHGLRRSFGTLSEWVECPVGICAQIMGHKPSALAEKHYRQRPLDLLRMWHSKIEAWILEQAGIRLPTPEK